MKRILNALFTLLLLANLTVSWAQSKPKPASADLKIDYEKYTLPNGLDVILHKDVSDPIVAVAIVFNVGSNREKPGRTGFAHFFEHMLFQSSENVGKGNFSKRLKTSAANSTAARGRMVRFIMKWCRKTRSNASCGWKVTAWVL